MSYVKIINLSGPFIDTVITYTKPEDCYEASSLRNIPISNLLKAILLIDKGGRLILACITANKRINLKKVQLMMGCRRLSFAPEEKVLETTNCPVGAVTPYADCEVIYDEDVSNNNFVNISAGNKNVSFNVNPKDLVKDVNPIVADIGDGE